MEELDFNSVEEFDELFSIRNSYTPSEAVQNPDLLELEGLIDYLNKKPTFNKKDFYEELQRQQTTLEFKKGGVVDDCGCNSGKSMFRAGGKVPHCFEEEDFNLEKFIR